MQLRDGHLVLSPTDVTKHVACAHVTTLDRAVVEGRLDAPADGVDAQLQLIFTKGLEHEKAHLASLRAAGLDVVEIPARGLTLVEREALTVGAMRAGADVVHQATLFDGAWVGFADFLLRTDRPGALGAWSYDIADTKLARRLKVPALLQMATYAVRLEQIQGVAPDRLVVVAGDGAHHPWRLVDVDAYARRVRGRLADTLAERPHTVPVPTPYCAQCRWRPRCRQGWEEADDLCLVAGLRSDQRHRLLEAGVSTLEALAGAGDDILATALSPTSRSRLRTQAALQLRERTTGAPAYVLLAVQPGQGLALLPEPDPGDVYLDFEGDPFAPGGQGLEYLAGVCERDGTFHAWWAHDAAAEREMVQSLLTWLVERWSRYPGMHVYHYAGYEQAALKRLTAREGTAESELDQLLRGRRLVDLYAVVRQGLQISKPSYSIKQLEGFYWGATRSAHGDQVADALSSVVEYERWSCGDRADGTILPRIEAYNRDDVLSTLALHDWLEERRAELVADSVEDVPRPGVVELDDAGGSGLIAAETELAGRLVDAGHPLLAGAVGWHRREDKQTWWEFFRTGTMSEDDLVEDRIAIGGVSLPERRGEVRRSVIWRYAFPPQDARLKVGATVHDARDHDVRVGTVLTADLEQGWVDVTLARGTPPPHVAGLVPRDWVDNLVLRQALLRLGEQVLAGEVTAGTALLERIVPCSMHPRPGETATDVVRRVGTGLSGQVLAVQGPPGAGKTYAASHLIADLVDRGLRVGVTAPSHGVFAHLMERCGRPGLRKVSSLPEDPDAESLVGQTADNASVVEALRTGEVRLVGGTAWLWTREDMRDSVDVLVVDEAGQFSLANALAVAQAARSLVLLGDPQQLAAPSSATHPYGAGVSVLEHLTDGAEVVPQERGVFLDRTWRMHPQITELVSTMSYGGRLLSAPGLDCQEVCGVPGLEGAGLRWVPVLHEGHSSDNPLEAEVVAGLVRRLLGGRWVDQAGQERPLRHADVLVVAPYNAHVAAVGAAVEAQVGAGVEVGTVDRFQGREAPVVVYTLASSSAADAPRGVDFLYDTHRLNVAVSRARALAVIVGSPALLEAPVQTPEQLRAVNALCRFVDAAEVVQP